MSIPESVNFSTDLIPDQVLIDLKMHISVFCYLEEGALRLTDVTGKEPQGVDRRQKDEPAGNAQTDEDTAAVFSDSETEALRIRRERAERTTGVTGGNR